MDKEYNIMNSVVGIGVNMLRCVVEDNKDPEHLGRVKLRVIGVHDAVLENIKTEDLPWSRVLNPVDAGNTLGSSTNVIQGTWGYCVSLNDNFTEFLLMGTVKGTFTEIPSATDDNGNDIGFRDPDGRFPVRLNEPDNPLTYGKPLTPDITQPRVKVATEIEPVDTAHNAKYPNNKVYEDYNGNIVEIDGTDGNARIRVQHSTGSRLEINVNGDVTISSTSNIWMKGTINIEGDINLSGDIIGTKGGTNISLSNHTHTGNLGASTTIPTPSI